MHVRIAQTFILLLLAFRGSGAMTMASQAMLDSALLAYELLPRASHILMECFSPPEDQVS